jgi:CRP-like cAMP-binding protein
MPPLEAVVSHAGGGLDTPLVLPSRTLAAPLATHASNDLLCLLRARAPDEYERLRASLTPVTFAQGDVLHHAGQVIDWVYFPEGCVASIVRTLSDGRQVEVGTTGFEGMAGMPAFLDAESVPLRCVAQVAGPAQRLSAVVLRREATHDSMLHGILNRYAQYLFDQAAQSIVCLRMHSLSHRCARWLLMTHDRVPGDQFALTQSYIAVMLGVHRPAVTLAAGALQDAGLIRYSRGRIRVLDRAGLEAAACECYASDRADLLRLLPPCDPSSAA